MTFHHLARGSAIALLAFGALAFAATPALAADVDFALDLKGSTLALGVDEKPATVSFTNLGTTTPKEVRIQYDFTELKPTISVYLGVCSYENHIAECVLDESLIPAPGTTGGLDVPLYVLDRKATGSQGKLKITVLVEGDANTVNDSKTVDVVLSGKSGADLRAITNDVTAVNGKGNPIDRPIPPGGESVAFGYIANHGDRAAAGITFAMKLPEQVTFTTRKRGCRYSANKRSVTCTFDGARILPWKPGGDNDEAAFWIPFQVQVSPDAKGPVSLAGGTWTAVASRSEPAPDARKRVTAAGAVLPSIAERLTPAQIAELDVDATDNTDDFHVLVAGGGAGGGGGDDDGDDDGGLPVTGPVAASVAGGGVAVLAVGTFLVVSARRRRIVLVTPADGK